ncbi:cupin domain-containing protein [Streptomyces sp. SID5914]|nr:cupin domain-containing protein [Streptomyces sp. SID5914]MZG13963.1 cupin domain-containing protein [Streptomyces sp. SID5914]
MEKLPFDELVPGRAGEPGGVLHVADGFGLGSRAFAPGEVFPAHHHNHFDELFIGVSGTLTVTVAGREVRLTPGDKVVCARGSVHSLANTTDSPAEIAYLKLPFVEDDTVWAEATA